MCQLLGMNANTPTDVMFSFTGLATRADEHKDGFGIGFFEGTAAQLDDDVAAPELLNPTESFNQNLSLANRFIHGGELSSSNRCTGATSQPGRMADCRVIPPECQRAFMCIEKSVSFLRTKKTESRVPSTISHHLSLTIKIIETPFKTYPQSRFFLPSFSCFSPVQIQSTDNT